MSLLWCVLCLCGAIILLKIFAPVHFVKFMLVIGLGFKIIFCFPSFQRLCSLIRKIPGNQSFHWLYGNLFQRHNKRHQSEYSDWAISSKHKIAKEWISPVLPCVNIHHPHLIMNTINTSRDYRLYHVTCPWIGKSSAFSAGKSRVDKRKLISDVFNSDAIHNFTQVYTECTNILSAKWKIKNTGTICIHDDISKLVLDVLLRCMYTFQSNCQNESSQYVQAIEDVSKSTHSRLFSSDMFPFSDFIYLYMTRQGLQYRQDCKYLHQMTEKFIKEHQGGQQSMLNMDLLDCLLVQNKYGLNNQEIRNEMDSFMFWGLRATTFVLSRTLYCLAKYPTIQQKCRQEVSDCMGSQYLIFHTDIPKFEYIACVIKETMRLYPPFEELYRNLPAETMIDNYLVPKDTTVCFKVKTIHSNPECWDDPKTFNPLRFDSTNSPDLHPYGYLPFSIGPRGCIAEEFSMGVMVVVIALIVKQFNLQLADNIKEETSNEDDYDSLMLNIQSIQNLI